MRKSCVFDILPKICQKDAFCAHFVLCVSKYEKKIAFTTFVSKYVKKTYILSIFRLFE